MLFWSILRIKFKNNQRNRLDKENRGRDSVPCCVHDHALAYHGVCGTVATDFSVVSWAIFLFYGSGYRNRILSNVNLFPSGEMCVNWMPIVQITHIRECLSTCLQSSWAGFRFAILFTRVWWNHEGRISFAAGWRAEQRPLPVYGRGQICRIIPEKSPRELADMPQTHVSHRLSSPDRQYHTAFPAFCRRALVSAC